MVFTVALNFTFTSEALRKFAPLYAIGATLWQNVSEAVGNLLANLLQGVQRVLATHWPIFL
jgi:hypothetical protein